MSPPIDIDGSEIQRATIDGEDVSEITIDGQQTAGFVVIPDSALTQDLVAWYRFEDGDARDYTAILDANFADTTAYDGTVNGATFQSSGGVRDFENGANSGAFDFDGSNDNVIVDNVSNTGISKPAIYGEISFGCWVSVDGGVYILSTGSQTDSEGIHMNNAGTVAVKTSSQSYEIDKFWPTTTTYQHLFATWDGNTIRGYLNGTQVDSIGGSSTSITSDEDLLTMGVPNSKTNDLHFNGRIDDVRIYNRALTASEVSNIYTATKP